MKKKILIIIILSTLISCSQKNKKSDFIGNWSTTYNSNFNINITFSKDSILIENPVVHLDKNYSTKWKILGKKIKLEKAVWDYKLSPSKDTLWIKHEFNTIYLVPFRRIKNNIEFLENKIGLKLNLPKTSESLTSIGNKEFVFPIYLAKQNDSLIIRTDGFFSKFQKT